MKRLYAVAAFLLFANAVNAGSLTFQVSDATDGAVTKTFSQFSDAHITRWIAANQSACNVEKNGTCSRVQVLNYIVTNFVAGQIALVKSSEKTAAAISAEEAVTPIDIKP